MRPFAENLGTTEKDGEECLVLRAGDITVALPIEEFVHWAVLSGPEQNPARTYDKITESVRLRALGMTNAAVAQRMGVTERTIYRWKRHLLALAP